MTLSYRSVVRGNPIDASGDFFPPQNGGIPPSLTNASRYATITYYDYQKDTTATVESNATPTFLACLGLTSSAQIGSLITFVGNQMNVPSNQGPLPAGFQMGIGDVNGEGTGAGTGIPARYQGCVVKIQYPPVLQLVPNAAGAYPNVVLSDGPAVYYQLGEPVGSTTAIDSSGNNLSATYQSGITLGSPGGIVNDPATSVSRSTDGNVLSAADAPQIDITTQLTIEFWVNSAVPSSSAVAFLTKWTGSQSNANFVIYQIGPGSNPNLFALYGTVGGTWLLLGLVTPPVGVWSHLVFTYNSATGGTTYLNGVVAGTQAPTGLLSTGEIKRDGSNYLL